MSAERTERVTVARTDTGPPWSPWTDQFLTSTTVLGYAIIFGGKASAVHYAMVAALGVLIATILFLMVELSHPYIGEISTSPEPLREVIGPCRRRRRSRFTARRIRSPHAYCDSPFTAVAIPT